MDLPKPFVIGCDLAGEVEAVGANATKYRKGDRVWGSNQGLLGRQGTFAEYAAVDECWLYPTPEEVSGVFGSHQEPNDAFQQFALPAMGVQEEKLLNKNIFADANLTILIV